MPPTIDIIIIMAKEGKPIGNLVHISIAHHCTALPTYFTIPDIPT